MKRIDEFEALRGLLALWVVVGHVLKHSGLLSKQLGSFALLAEPGLPVDVFIILSGFVIFSLLDSQRQSYGQFLVQRFFRLYPMYIVALFGSVLLLPLTSEWLASSPWQTEFAAGTTRIASESAKNLTSHILAHLSMLHGLVPDSVLAQSQYAILGQAWSISVEWQFYLIAPLIFVLIKRSPLGLIAMMLIVGFLHSRYALGEGFVVNQGGYFLIGILSFFLFRGLGAVETKFTEIWFGVTVAGLFSAYFVLRPLSVLIWCVMMGAAVCSEKGYRNTISEICSTPLLQWLGKISYSVYLIHMIVLMLISTAIMSVFSVQDSVLHAVVALPLTIAATLLLAWVSYRVVESPGISLGRRISARFFSTQDTGAVKEPRNG